MTKIEDAQERIAAAQSDVEGDFGPDAWEQAAYDVIQGIAADYDRVTRKEILRVELGVDLDADEKSDREYWAAQQLRFNPLPICDDCGSIIASHESHEDDCPKVSRARERVAAIRHEYGANRGDHR